MQPKYCKKDWDVINRNKMEEKGKSKKRGSNYMPDERSKLLQIVTKYKSIIESKETNSVFAIQKKKCWEKISEEYNAHSLTGTRDWKQLRNLYDNMKQKTRKTMAKNNKKEYLNRLQELDQNIMDLKAAKKKASDDKKEINKTGGGSYQTQLNNEEAQVLALIAPQIEPLPNPYDSSAFYFGDHNYDVVTDEVTVGNLDTMQDEYPMVEHSDFESQQINTVSEEHGQKHFEIEIRDELDEFTEDAHKDIASQQINNTGDEDVEITPMKTPRGKEQPKKVPKKTLNRRVKNNETRLKYYRLKVHNAHLERKFLYQQNQRKKELHNLECSEIQKRNTIHDLKIKLYTKKLQQYGEYEELPEINF